jgi:site-specific recombinase XerD
LANTALRMSPESAGHQPPDSFREVRNGSRWQIYTASRDLLVIEAPRRFLVGLPGDLSPWLDEEDVPDGAPYLLSPTFEYDITLNSYFLSTTVGEPENTTANRVRALKRFLDFLWIARDRRSWRDATEADHLAFFHWRRRDESGPRVSGATWSQEVALVNEFYKWAVNAGHAHTNPIPQRQRRAAPPGAAAWRGNQTETVPATYAHDENGEHIEWLSPPSYRKWRDVGLRGYGNDGLPDCRFRGRWASRNATYADLMVRTGMRLSEQSSLTVLEVPTETGLGGYQRFWLPGPIAKRFSARWIYVSESVIRDLASYVEYDRAEMIEQAREAGRYRQIRQPFVIEDPSQPTIVRQPGNQSHHSAKLAQLNPRERQRLFIDTDSGLEPALFWLNENGLPMTTSGWQSVFDTANQRCAAMRVALSSHPHLLRHSFAVVTLEQLQRGHIAALSELSPDQRGHYTRIFGDPLDWVRRRLGHASVVTTAIYLHEPSGIASGG